VIFEIGNFLDYFSMWGGKRRAFIGEILKSKRLSTKSVMLSNIEVI